MICRVNLDKMLRILECQIEKKYRYCLRSINERIWGNEEKRTKA